MQPVSLSSVFEAVQDPEDGNYSLPTSMFRAYGDTTSEPSADMPAKKLT